MDHENIIFFKEFKPYPSHLDFEKKSLFANIACVCVIVFFFFYFVYKFNIQKIKHLEKKKR